MITLELDYSKRHCWPRIDGKYYLDNGELDPAECLTWREHVLLAGPCEFLRWIWAMKTYVGDFFTKEGTLKTGSEYSIYLGRDAYCENYSDKIYAFLEPPWAFVEIRDAQLIDAASRALEDVQKEYQSYRL